MAQENHPGIHEDAASVEITRKIKTPEEILQEVGRFPRSSKLIMCHGTFDNLHIGHIRQLMFAKTKATTLVVSLTCDRHVPKGPIRPWMPEQFRALHLASLGYVDYVIIDQNLTPIENINVLKPDFFVKGFEYSQGGNPRTQEEIDTLASYGGEMIFSPGDIVYSSTKILATEAKPRIPLERVSLIMHEEGITIQDLATALENIHGLKVTVAGDLIVDRYHFCATPMGQSQEEEVPSYSYVRSEEFIGGAGVVAKHLASLGAKVTLATVLGNDSEGEHAIANLKENGVIVQAVIDHTRPTIVKERFVGVNNNRLLFKGNRLDNTPINDDILKALCRTIEETLCSATIFSDFRHGIFNRRTLPMLTSSIPDSSLKIADSQVSTRWGNILEFEGFDVITPNEREARWSLGDQDTPIRPLAQELYNRAGCKYLVLKLGAEGIIVYRSSGRESREYFYLETLATNVVDHIGAGDALLSASTASLASSKNIVIASIIGNIAAAIECSKQGNVPVKPEEILDIIAKIEI